MAVSSHSLPLQTIVQPKRRACSVPTPQAKAVPQPAYATMIAIVITDGSMLAAPAPPTYKIEFIGDSILTGWGSRFAPIWS